MNKEISEYFVFLIQPFELTLPFSATNAKDALKMMCLQYRIPFENAKAMVVSEKHGIELFENGKLLENE